MALPWLTDHMGKCSLPSCVFSTPARYTKKHKINQEIYTATHTYANICFALIGVSLYVAVGTDKQCELTCRPAGYRFYVRQAERVRDGTPCVNVTSNDVCVEGRCLVSAFKPACEVDIVQNLGWLILTSRG